MALTPINYAVIDDELLTEEIEIYAEPSMTWKFDLENGRIGSFIDGKEAIRQYIRKALMTARNHYLIYDDYYGEEIRDLIGHNLTPQLMNVEIPRLVREAIIYDDRIASVPTVDVSQYGSDGIHVSVTVELTDGELLTEEVAI
ncbi:DUF2634 domain-containing protein [Lysinibacillus sp. NPDC093712]|uniref:DUF2634 domain-containing protein n=1 Tax=Lysinibacillus sp. NPDC093712 TaxID=3390579 RepID=UPI003D047B5F